MMTARTAMHYLAMAAFICATSQSALAQSVVNTTKVTPVAVKSAPAPKSAPVPKPAPAPKPPKPAPTPVAKTCLDVYNGVGVKAATLVSAGATLVSASATPAPTLSSTDLKNKNIQDALRAALLKVALVALSKLPPGKACDAVIAKIDAKFSRS